MIGLSQYINESVETNLSNFNNEIESLNKKFTKYTFKLFDKNGEHLFVHDKNSKDWYSPLPDKFVLDKRTIKDIVRTAPKLSEAIYVAVKTYELKDNQSRINGTIKYCARPVLTNQGMFFNSGKECKKFIKAVKSDLLPENREAKKYKLVPMSLKSFVDFLNDETNKGEYYNYEHLDTQFAKWES